jgi:hypothetical protein
VRPVRNGDADWKTLTPKQRTSKYIYATEIERTVRGRFILSQFSGPLDVEIGGSGRAISLVLRRTALPAGKDAERRALALPAPLRRIGER